jgi:poly(hydroxyalkanoate) granule-associated protein
MAEGAGKDNQLASAIKESAQQIWLAGLGAFSKAQAEGGKVFEALVKEGASLQKKTQSVAEERFGDVTSRMTSMADDVGAKAGRHWDKLEAIFEDRTARAMKKLGVPTAREVEALKERIDALSAQLARSARATARPKATKGAKTATKSAAGRSAKRARKSAG